MTQPLVGVAGQDYVVPRPWGELPAMGAPRAYVEGLRAAGAQPVVLPPGFPAEALGLLDGLVLMGGGDLDPDSYGGRAGPDSVARDVDRSRDAAELALVPAAREIGLPLLGVCRGLQVMAVASGGTLIPDLPHVRPGTGHQVRTSPGSVVAGLLGAEPDVSALHHQAVAGRPPHWRTTAHAHDGVIEALEWADQDAWPAVGVQWHPELDATGPALFGWLVQVAQSRSRTRTIPASVATYSDPSGARVIAE